MKRFLAAVFAGAMALTALTGCEDIFNPPVEEESSSRVERVSSSVIDPAIIGTWKNDVSGYIFGENRKVSLPMDFTASAHFNKDGSFTAEGVDISKDEVEFDGTNLKVAHDFGGDEESSESEEDTVLLDMTRKGSADKSSFDGTYKLSGGSYLEMIADNLGIDYDKIDVEAEIDGENFRITVVDYCLYETLGDSLELFSENMQYVDENANALKYTYKIDGDTLTLTYATGETEVLTKAE